MRVSEVYNEDCMTGMARYPDKFFNLAIVDPPYGINIGHANYIKAEGKKITQKNGSRIAVRKNRYPIGDWDNAIPTIEYFNELKRVSEHQIIWGWNYYGLDWGPGIIKWDKMHAAGVNFNQYEYAYCSLLDREMEVKLLWSGMMQAKSLSEPTRQQGNKTLNERRIHPTQKPVLLYKYLLNEFGWPYDRILDTHMGSQSSRIAASDLKFYDYWGFEINPQFFKDGNKRFAQHTAQISLL